MIAPRGLKDSYDFHSTCGTYSVSFNNLAECKKTFCVHLEYRFTVILCPVLWLNSVVRYLLKEEVKENRYIIIEACAVWFY